MKPLLLLMVSQLRSPEESSVQLEAEKRQRS